MSKYIISRINTCLNFDVKVENCKPKMTELNI